MISDSLTQFYNNLWGKSKYWRSIWYCKKKSRQFKSEWFKSNKEAIDFIKKISKSKEYDVYHANALFSEKKRIQSKVVEIKALWLDLDLKKSSKKDLKGLLTSSMAFKDFILTNNFSIIFSGHGFHIYWILETPLDPKSWKQLANLLHDYVKTKKIEVDDSRTRDSASLLRAIRTWNLKEAPVETKILRLMPTIALDLKTIIKSNTKQDFSKADFNLSNNLCETNFKESNFNTIIDKCLALRTFCETGYADNEPAWYAALGVVRLCKDGQELAHNYSKIDPSYTYDLTQKKLDQLTSNNVGPSLCARFNDLNCCGACPYVKKLTSPIQLGVDITPIVNPIQDIEDDSHKKRAQELINLAPEVGWIIGKEGIYRNVEDIPIQISHVPFYIIDIFNECREDQSLLTVLIRAYSKSKIINFKFPLKYLADDRKLIGEFNARGIFPTNKKYLREYLTTYLKKIEHININRAIVAFGWQDDNSFVFNSSGHAFLPNNEFSTCILDDKMIEYVKGFRKKGKLSQWNLILKVYESHPLWLPHLFSLLCALGAPLIPLTSAKGILLSLEGDSGGGKTLAHKAAMSIWGNPESAGILQPKGSAISFLGKLGAVKNLPLRLDEATLLGAARLSGFVYQIVNGHGRERATKDGSLSSTSAEWQTVTLSSSNRPLLENDISIISEAERNRILELNVKSPPKVAKLGPFIDKIMKNNHGVLGQPFIKWVVNNRDKTQRIIEKYTARFQKHVEDDKRFWVSCGAAAFAATNIALSLNLIDLDIAKVQEWFINVLKKQSTLNNIYVNESRGFETKEEFVRALSDSLCGQLLYLNGYHKVIERPHKEVKGRIITDSDGNTKLYVRPPILREFVQKYYVCSLNRLKQDLQIPPAKTLRFGDDGVVKCYEFNLTDHLKEYEEVL